MILHTLGVCKNHDKIVYSTSNKVLKLTSYPMLFICFSFYYKNHPKIENLRGEDIINKPLYTLALVSTRICTKPMDNLEVRNTEGSDSESIQRQYFDS